MRETHGTSPLATRGLLVGMLTMLMQVTSPVDAAGSDAKTPATAQTPAIKPAAAAVQALLNPVRTLEGVHEYKLPNGLTVLLAPDTSAQKTYVNLVYNVGSLQEGYGESGMAHLLEHLVLRRTVNTRNPMAEMQRRGMLPNGTTSYDRTNYFASFAPDAATMDWYLGWLAESMTGAVITREELDSEMTVVRNEFEIGENRGASVAWQRIRRAAYQWHGYGRAIIGARSDIENVPIDRLQAFYTRWYRPDNATLILSGAFDSQAALQRIQQSFGAIAKPSEPLTRPYTQEPVQDGEREVTVRRTGGAPMLGYSWHSVPAIHKDDAPLDVLGVILAGGATSRLHKQLVDTGLAVNLSAGNTGHREAGTFNLVVTPAAEDKIPEVRKVVDEALIKLSNEPVSDDELTLAKRRLINGAESSLRSAESVGRSLSEGVAVGDWRYPFWSRDELAKVSADDVRRVAASWLQAGNRTLGIYLPTVEPKRAPEMARHDPAPVLGDYQGRKAADAGEALAADPDAIEQRIQRGKLPSGIKLALLPKASKGDRVRGMLRLNWGTLQSLTGEDHAGTSGNLLLAGTKQYTREQLTAKLAELDASLSANGAAGGVTLSFETSKANWPELLKLVAEVVRNPVYPDKEVENWRRAVLSQLQASADEPAVLASQAIAKVVQPYAERDPRRALTTAESVERVKAITAEGLRAFHRKFASTKDAEFAAVGALDADATRAQLTSLFGDWTSQQPYQRIVREALPYQPSRVQLDVAGKANAVFQAQSLQPFSGERAEGVAGMLAVTILGGGPGSRLHERVREREGLSYSVWGQASFLKEESLASFGVSASFAPQNRAKLEAVIRDELDAMIKNGFTEQELAQVRDRLLKREKLGLGDDANLLNVLAADLPYDRTMSWTAERIKLIQSVTLDQVNAAARRYLSPDKLVIGVSGTFAAK